MYGITTVMLSIRLYQSKPGNCRGEDFPGESTPAGSGRSIGDETRCATAQCSGERIEYQNSDHDFKGKECVGITS